MKKRIASGPAIVVMLIAALVALSILPLGESVQAARRPFSSTAALFLPLVKRAATLPTVTPTATLPTVTPTPTMTPTPTSTPEPPFFSPWEDGGLEVEQQAGQIVNDGRVVPYRFFVPVPDAARPRPYPAVVFLPGFLIQTNRYLPLSEHIASHGFIVIAADPETGLVDSNHLEMRDDALAVLDHALVVLADEVDETAIATSGHSLGGKLATMMADIDSRVNGLFGIDPVNGAGPGGYTPTRPNILPEAVADLTYPILVLGQTDDPVCAPLAQNFQNFYDAATSTPWRTAIEFQGADHIDFVDDPGLFGLPCPDGTADDARVLAIRQMFAVAYFQFALNGDTRYEPYLLDPESLGVLPGEVIVQHDGAAPSR